jgi:hypothetical protein
MRATPQEKELARALAARIAKVALHHETDVLQAYVATEIIMIMVRYRRRCGRRHGADPAFV